MSNDGLARGIGQVEDGVAKSVKRKKVSQLEGEKFISSLVGTIDYDRFKEVRTMYTQYTPMPKDTIFGTKSIYLAHCVT